MHADTATVRPLAPKAYLDEAHFERERELLFMPNWVAIGHVSQFTEKGSYVATDLHGTPVVLVQQANGSIKALSNVCRHRLYPIMRGSGKANRLMCPYHAWVYGLDGQLRSAPQTESTPGFDRTKIRLPGIRTEIWHGLIFATLNPDAAALAPQLSALGHYIEQYDLAGLHDVAQFELDQAWNWKIMAENFSEGYHHTTQHPESIPHHPASTGFCPEPDDGPYWIWESNGRPESPGRRLLGIGVFPYTLFAIDAHRERRSAIWLHMQELRPRHHKLVMHILVDDALAASPEGVESVRKQVPRFHLEDMVLCEETQRGMASPLAMEPILCRHHERVIERFHGWIRDQFSSREDALPD